MKIETKNTTFTRLTMKSSRFLSFVILNEINCSSVLFTSLLWKFDASSSPLIFGLAENYFKMEIEIKNLKEKKKF